MGAGQAATLTHIEYRLLLPGKHKEILSLFEGGSQLSGLGERLSWGQADRQPHLLTNTHIHTLTEMIQKQNHRRGHKTG